MWRAFMNAWIFGLASHLLAVHFVAANMKELVGKKPGHFHR